MSKYDKWHQLECQNRILNVKILYWASVGMSKSILGSILNVKKNQKKSEKRKAISEKRITKLINEKRSAKNE